jgi:hypothetical protein
MHRIIVFLGLTLLCFKAYNQVMSISAGTGVGTSQMEDLKTFQDDLLSDMPVLGKIVDNFPAFPLYDVKIVFFTKYLEIGNGYTFTSTGSKIHYSDYSGEISIIQIVNSHQPSLLLYPVLHRSGNSKILGVLKGAAVFNNYSLKQEIKVYDQEASDQLELKSSGLAFSLGLSYCYRMHQFEIRSEIEYLIDTKAPLHLTNDKDAQLVIYDKPVKTDWSGLRIGISIGWCFDRKE